MLSFTIADGSSDFELGDSFTITVVGSSTYTAYDFAADPTPPQVATAVLGADVDATAGSVEQLATASGPAILAGATVTGSDAAVYNAIREQIVDQLARCGIILRGALQFRPT